MAKFNKITPKIPDHFVVLVAGGRNFTNRFYIFSVLNKLHDFYRFNKIIHGGSRGVDKASGYWAAGFAPEVTVMEVLPDYSTGDEKKAPLIRNTKMVKMNPDLVVVFPGGTGTLDLTNKALKAGLPVISSDQVIPLATFERVTKSNV